MVRSDAMRASVYSGELRQVPPKIEMILIPDELLEDLARESVRARDLHSRRELSAREMKHGTDALIDENLAVVVLATCDRNHPQSVLH